MSQSSLSTNILPEGFARGPLQGKGILGELTEAVHQWLLDGWDDEERPRPRLEEDLSFVPKDRQEVIYAYMYRVGRNTALQNSKNFRPARIQLANDDPDRSHVYYERPPIYLDVYYVVAVHSKFRSDAERLLGWVMLRLWEASRLIYRPRRFILPDGRVVDSTGKPWSLENTGDDVIMEKVSLALVDDLPIGDAINFFTIHEAPFRPFLTYRAQCALEGSLVGGPSSTIYNAHLDQHDSRPKSADRPSGRLGSPVNNQNKRPRLGPKGYDHGPLPEDTNSED